MSGWTGIIELNGAPADASLVARMTHLAERHGGRTFKVDGEAEFAFGHSQLASMPESEKELQPLSFDGNIWIVGDVRVDARAELTQALAAEGREVHLDRPDIEFVLHAFYAWGESCVDYLIGDFAFIVWNRRKKQLFCARDTFGVKPFYFRHDGDRFVCGNDIYSMRIDPDVSDKLNEAAIGDYLTIGYNLDESRTYFADINRLPPSHTLTVEGCQTAPRLRKYMKLSIDQGVQFASQEEYCEHFLALFKIAVGDRLRTDHIGFELSGGLDSTSVAAMAALVGKDMAGFSGRAVTTDNSLHDPADKESFFARKVADHLGFQHLLVEARSNRDFYAHCRTPQPFASPYMAISLRFSDCIRSHSDVMLSGQGGDPVLHSSGLPLLDQYRELSLVAFIRTLIATVVNKRRLRGLGLRSLHAGDKPRIRMRQIPCWVRSDFIARTGLAERFWELYGRPGRYPEGCQAELAWDELHMPVWTHLFEDYYHDLFHAIDCRHPWFDLRLIRFLLAIPPSFKADKRILRLSMKPLLPTAVLERPKARIANDRQQAKRLDESLLALAAATRTRLTEWIDDSAYQAALKRYAAGAAEDRFAIVAPVSLALWMDEQLS